MWMLLEKISICISKLNEALSSPIWMGIIPSIYNLRVKERPNSFSLLELGCPSFLPSDIKPLALRLPDSGWIIPRAFLGLKHVDSKL